MEDIIILNGCCATECSQNLENQKESQLSYLLSELHFVASILYI